MFKGLFLCIKVENVLAFSEEETILYKIQQIKFTDHGEHKACLCKSMDKYD